MKSGATESSYFYLEEHYKIPDNVFVHHLPEEIKKSNHEYKILWAQHAYDQPFFLDFDHHILHHTFHRIYLFSYQKHQAVQ
jgi:hypothetical protein